MIQPPAERAEPLLQLNRATVVREGRMVLEDLTLTLEQGEHTAIVGPNGSGKSTLIQLLTCQLYPLARRGQPPVLLFGRPRWNLADLRSRLGIVSADYHLRFVAGSSLGHVTARQAVLASFFASEILFLHHEVTEQMRARAAAALLRMDVAHLADVQMNRMSTGEVRRVLIARALVHHPRVLILDEPTTGLDLVARGEFLQLIRRLAREGTTIVLVTHHVEEIIPEIGRVILLREGRISRDGDPAEALTSESLSRAFAAPLELERFGGTFRATLRAESHPRFPEPPSSIARERKSV
jgi:iron complex transport system ATP-binding protein